MQLSLTRDCKVFDEVYDRVILALPFTTLRQVDIEDAGFQPLKRHAIDSSEWAPAPSSSFALKIATFGTTTKPRATAKSA